jgi:colanic acid/amylovoran biosynthesis glycosyltransferase
MKIIYVTSTLPYGSREAFLIPEIAELSRNGHDLTIVPMRPQGEVVHDDVRPFLGATLALPLICGKIIGGAFAEALSFPLRTLRACHYLFRSRNPRIFVRNVSVFAKGVWLSRQARRLEADHLHAHWAATSSTMTLVAAEISGIPWSFTAHRWDIAEDNLLAIKISKACFVRAISEKGAQAVASYLATPARKLHVLHVGIDVSGSAQPPRREPDETRLAVVAVADFVEVKGHRHLLEALRILKDRGPLVQLELVGDGPLRAELERQVEETGLSDWVTLLGTVPHASLLSDLKAHRWDAVVLPSIVTEKAEEGIPVSLIEAMGAGIPVLSTRTGAIPELLRDGAGLLVEAGDAVGLADALEELARKPALRERLAEEGHRRVVNDFNILIVTSALAECFEKCAERPLVTREAEEGGDTRP